MKVKNIGCISEKYKIIETLNRGSEGEVFKAWDKDSKRVVALKKLIFFGSQESELNRAINSANIMGAVESERICKIIEVDKDLSTGNLYEILEYCKCDLNALISSDISRDVMQTRKLMKQILEAANVYFYDC